MLDPGPILQHQFRGVSVLFGLDLVGETHVDRHEDVAGLGLLDCRICAFDGALVEFETIHHREDASDRIAGPTRLRLDGFLEHSFGRWYERQLAAAGGTGSAARSAGCG
jgi:hypothetical protein